MIKTNYCNLHSLRYVKILQWNLLKMKFDLEWKFSSYLIERREKVLILGKKFLYWEKVLHWEKRTYIGKKSIHWENSSVRFILIKYLIYIENGIKMEFP